MTSGPSTIDDGVVTVKGVDLDSSGRAVGDERLVSPFGRELGLTRVVEVVRLTTRRAVRTLRRRVLSLAV